MKLYSVDIPFTGYVTIEVEAENEKDAEEIAYEQVSADDLDESATFEFHKRIVRGNVFYGVLNKIEATLQDD
jgi:hypothetical protein